MRNENGGKKAWHCETMVSFSITNQSTVNKIVEWLTNKGFPEEVGERFERKQTLECPVFIYTETQQKRKWMGKQ